jgi:hypothetical protein
MYVCMYVGWRPSSGGADSPGAQPNSDLVAGPARLREYSHIEREQTVCMYVCMYVYMVCMVCMYV